MSDKKEQCDNPKVQDFCVPDPAGLQCACSKTLVTKTGTGSTTRRHFKKQFFYLQQTGDEEFAKWEVNAQHVPAGEKETITMAEVMGNFHPEVDYYVQKVAPALRKLRKHIARGDKHRRNNQPYSAEMEYKGALSLDEQNVRATFGLGLTYLQFDEPEKGAAVFENLVKIDGAFDPEHKHLFNEFGIQLRKNKLYPQAVDYYTRALEISSDDENLHFNVARSRFENKDWLMCVKHICRTLEMNDSHEKGLLFAKYLLKTCRDGRTSLAKGLGDFAEDVVSRLSRALESDPEGAHLHLADLRQAVDKQLAIQEKETEPPEQCEI